MKHVVEGRVKGGVDEKLVREAVRSARAAYPSGHFVGKVAGRNSYV